MTALGCCAFCFTGAGLTAGFTVCFAVFISGFALPVFKTG